MRFYSSYEITIGITSTIDKTELEKALNNILKHSEFNKLELDEKRSYENTELPKAHYSFSYQSNFNTNANYIFLDILFQDNHYPEINEFDIKTPWLSTEEPFLKVKVPTANSILGDKLTAFAPNTTGVPYKKRKKLEIVKQLFDISLLINKADNYSTVKDSFFTIVKSEIEYRKKLITGDDVLDDIFDTALVIASREKNTGENIEKFNEIKNGLLRLTPFIINSTFRIENAIEASAKAAWFAMKLKNSNLSLIELYTAEIDLSKIHIENNDYQFLNKLKKANKPAFYYWYKCLEEKGFLNNPA